MSEKYPETKKLDIKYEKIYFSKIKLSKFIYKIVMFGRNKKDSKKKKIKVCGQLDIDSGRYYTFRKRYEDDQKNIEKKTHYFVNYSGYGISEAIFLQDHNVKEILFKEELIKNNGYKETNYYLIPFEIFMREAVTHIDYSNYFRDVQYIFPRITRLNIKNPIYFEEKKRERQTQLQFTGVKIED
jgi:hypothetical protein